MFDDLDAVVHALEDAGVEVVLGTDDDAGAVGLEAVGEDDQGLETAIDRQLVP